MMEIDDTPAGRGKRLRILRKLSDLTSADLAELAGLSRASISIWENAVTRGLTRKGAEQLISALKSKNISCDINWLWFGIGAEPHNFNLSMPNQTAKITYLQHTHTIVNSPFNQEIQLFLSSYSNSLVMQVENMSLMPFLMKGDVVGGIWKNQLSAGDFDICILEIDNTLQVRQILASSREKIYDLSFTSYCQDELKPYRLSNTKIERIAPIKRVWR